MESKRRSNRGSRLRGPHFVPPEILQRDPVKCSAFTVAQKIETECFYRNLPISNDSVVRISRNLAKEIVNCNMEIGNC